MPYDVKTVNDKGNYTFFVIEQGEDGNEIREVEQVQSVAAGHKRASELSMHDRIRSGDESMIEMRNSEPDQNPDGLQPAERTRVNTFEKEAGLTDEDKQNQLEEQKAMGLAPQTTGLAELERKVEGRERHEGEEDEPVNKEEDLSTLLGTDEK